MADQNLYLQAVEAIKSGDKALGRRSLTQLLRADPYHAEGWLWLAKCVSDPAKQRDCLEKVLSIQPDNHAARMALVRLDPSTDQAAHKRAPRTNNPKTKANRQPSQKTGPKINNSQIGVLFSLALVALAAVSGLGFTVLQDESFSRPAAAAKPFSTATSSADLTGISNQFPATWTPHPTPSPNTTSSFSFSRSSATPIHINTPVPSLTAMVYRRSVIGYSVSGRPLEVYRFGRGPTERMIVAGIHGGGEWNTIALADELIEHFRQYPEAIPADMTLYILRALNPDGDARSHSADGRVNENGVDLNRNWDAGWQYDWPRQGCWVSRPTNGGAYPNSEPETQALANFLIDHRVDALINYHSAALGVFPSGDPPDPASERLAEAIAAVSDYPYPPVKTGCEFSGTLVDWALKLGIAGVDLELSDHSHTDFETNLQVLDVLLTWQRASAPATPIPPRSPTPPLASAD